METERFIIRDPDDRCREEEEEEEEDCKPQTHVHEFISSTQLAEECDDRHNHRFAGVSGQVIPVPGGHHVHRLFTRTDFLDHFHLIKVISSIETPLPDPDASPSQLKHVHFVEGFTTVRDGHRHEFEFGTLVEALLVDEDVD